MGGGLRNNLWVPSKVAPDHKPPGAPGYREPQSPRCLGSPPLSRARLGVRPSPPVGCGPLSQDAVSGPLFGGSAGTGLDWTCLKCFAARSWFRLVAGFNQVREFAAFRCKQASCGATAAECREARACYHMLQAHPLPSTIKLVLELERLRQARTWLA